MVKLEMTKPENLIPLTSAAFNLKTHFNRPTDMGGHYEINATADALIYLGIEGIMKVYGCMRRGKGGKPGELNLIGREVFLGPCRLEISRNMLIPERGSPHWPMQFTSVFIDQRSLFEALRADPISVNEALALGEWKRVKGPKQKGESRSEQKPLLNEEEIYQAYINNLISLKQRSSLADDIEHMKKFRWLSRENVRDLRKRHAPESWQKAGRIPKK